MPVRSSICTYSPSSVSNSRYNPTSSLSVGHYKPFSSSSLTTSKSYSPGSQVTTNARYSISSFNPSQLNSSSYSSISSTSSYTPSTGSYRPLSSAHNSFNNGRYGSNSLLGSSATSAGYSRYSSTLSTGSASSSSISSSSSLIDRTDTLSRKYSKSSGYNYQPSIGSLEKSSFKVSKISLLAFLLHVRISVDEQTMQHNVRQIWQLNGFSSRALAGFEYTKTIYFGPNLNFTIALNNFDLHCWTYRPRSKFY